MGECAAADGARGDDAHLVARVAAGDRGALTELYLHERLPLLRYLRQFTPDAGLAEELLQDTLVAAWQSARRYEGRSTARAWLLGIARRQAHNTLRRRGVTLADDAALATMPTAAPGPEEQSLAAASSAAVAATLARLPTHHREVLLLAVVEELSYREIAAVLDVPTGTVGTSPARGEARAAGAPTRA